MNEDFVVFIIEECIVSIYLFFSCEVEIDENGFRNCIFGGKNVEFSLSVISRFENKC